MVPEKYFIILVSLATFFLVKECESHARLLDPVSRGSLWRVRSNAPKDEDDAGLSCGGFDVLHGRNRGRCGVCGDPVHLNSPRPHEFGGRFGKGGVVKSFIRGKKMVIDFDVVIVHGGRVEFKVCPAPQRGEVTQGCLDAHPLRVLNGKRSSSFFEVKKKGLSKITLQLPRDLTCARCVLQYSYIGADRKGTCANGKKKDGCGPQALYRGCADIAIRTSRGRRQACFGVGIHKRNEGMRTWCTENCQIGYCPPSHCDCEPISEDNSLD